MGNAEKNNVVVLMATFNGLSWLSAQIESILQQSETNILLFISDDHSTDGTWEWLQNLVAQDARVRLLPRSRKFGSAAPNFYRLILDADISNCDFIAFSDQDDIWESNKLVRHIGIAQKGGFDGVSSNVAAFWPDGVSANIIKSQAQREFDYLFQSAGAGCTYLMTPGLIHMLRLLLTNPDSGASEVALHDWLAYAVCRAAGKRWHIDEATTVRYRQHDSNEFGANHGLQAKASRFKRLKNGWYRSEVIKILNVCLLIKPNDRDFLFLSSALKSEGLMSRIQLMRYVNKARRSMIDRAVLAASITLFLF